MSEWNEPLAQYLRILQSEGQTHLVLSKSSLQTLRTLVTGGGVKTTPVSAPVSTSSESSSSNRVVEEKKTVLRTPVKVSSPSTPVLTSSVGIAPVSVSGVDLATGSRSERMERLKAQVLQCQQCSHLASTRTQVVFGVGNPEATLMFVGEAPGADEDAAGEPFVGKAGQLLTKMIQAMGLERDQIYIGNVLKCRPDMPAGSSGNRKPTSDEMKTCVPLLQAQIQIIQPKVLVALGATAIEGLLQDKTPISKIRGNFLTYQGIPLMPTYHPAYLLRNQSNTEKRKVWEDLLKVMEKLELPISDKQRGYFLTK